MDQYINYLRASKAHTLKLADQKAAVREFIELNGGEVIASFTEKAGATGQFPTLQQAIAKAKETGAWLLIAKIGRLNRNLVFTTTLYNSGVKFACCDMEEATHLTAHVMVGLATEESQRIRQRTREGLARAKARGVKLGAHRPGHWDGKGNRGLKLAIAGSIAKRKERAASAYHLLLPDIKTRRERGDTLPEIAEWLNQTGHTTTVGKPFTEVAVWRIIDRYIGKEYLGNNTRKFGKTGT